ncbi:MAG: putative membrane protein YeiH [Phenylobacterium sp.]|jgi:uncharacterized membrane protein YeiH
MEQYFHLFDLAGAAVFAISGVLMAYRKHIDAFGALVLAAVTAVGGGTLRDIILDLPVFWVVDPSTLLSIFAAAVMTIIWLRFQSNVPAKPLLIADAIGLAFFVVMGCQKALEHGHSDLIAILMGMITGAFGGLIRDVICQQMPLVFKGDLYAIPAILGGLTYTQCLALGVSAYPAMISGMLVTLLMRLGAMKWHWTLEVFKPHD